MEMLRIVWPGRTEKVNPNILECRGIRMTPEGIGVIESGRVVLTLLKSDVQRIILRRGMQAQHPVIQLIFGIVLLVTGLIPLPFMVFFPDVGVIAMKLGVGALVLVILGGWLLFESLRRGYFLDVETKSGWKKLPLSKGHDIVEFESFLRAAKDTLGYPIEADAGATIL